MWIADWVSPVELDYLGLDRFMEQERAADQAEEDAFCMRLRKVGAKWWHDYNDFTDAVAGARQMTKEEATRLLLCWPEEGGVWVLKIDGRENAEWEGGGWSEGGWREGRMVYNAYTMRERCQAIERLGGVFFKNPKECEDTKDLV
jgi:hypothetical protein